MRLRAPSLLFVFAAATLVAASSAGAEYTSPWGDTVSIPNVPDVPEPTCVEGCDSGSDGDGRDSARSEDPAEAARREEARRRAEALLRQAEAEERVEVERIDANRERLEREGSNLAVEAEAFRRYAEAVRRREENPHRFIAPYFRPAPPLEPVRLSAIAQLRCAAAQSAQALSIAQQGSAAGLPAADLSFVDANRMATEASVVFDSGRGAPGCASFEPARRSLKSITLRSGRNAAGEAKRIASELPVMLEQLAQSSQQTQEAEARVAAADAAVKEAQEAVRAAELAAPSPAPPAIPAPPAEPTAPTPPPVDPAPPPAPPNPLLERLRKNKADAEEAKRKEEERLAEVTEQQRRIRSGFEEHLEVAREIAKATGEEP